VIAEQHGGLATKGQPRIGVCAMQSLQRTQFIRHRPGLGKAHAPF
jgi:hypothetical protein